MRASPLGMRLFKRPVAVVSAATTFNSATSTNDWTFTNGNLTAERTVNNNFHAIARGSVAKTAGSFTATVDAQPGGGLGVGFDDGTTSGNNPGFNGAGVAILQDGAVWYNGSFTASGVTYTVGDVITATKTGNLVTFKKNGVDVGVSTDVSATLSSVVPLVYVSTGASVGSKYTANFGGW